MNAPLGRKKNVHIAEFEKELLLLFLCMQSTGNNGEVSFLFRVQILFSSLCKDGNSSRQTSWIEH